MPDDPIWARVLDAIYNKRLQHDDFDEYGYTKLARANAIADEEDLTSDEVHAALTELEKNGLIQDLRSGQESQGYKLTEKGFDVAHERELQELRREHEKELQRNRRELQEALEDDAEKREKRQHEVNRAIGFLTLGLLTIGLIESAVIATVNSTAIGVSPIVFLVLGACVVAVIVRGLWKSEMLKSWEQFQ